MDPSTVVAPRTPRSHESNRAIGLPLIVTLGLLSAVAPFATDLYLPAFPQMVGDLSTSATQVQLTLTAFLVGAGLGQVVFGPLSDRVGRRSPLIAGAFVYVAASAAAALAPTIGLLVLFRLVQGLSGAAGMVIGRAIIADHARGPESARAFSVVMLVSGIAPIVAPFAGSVFTGPLGWRGLLWIVAALGVLAVIAVLAIVYETHFPTRGRPGRAETSRSTQSVRTALCNWPYLGNAFAFAFGFATMMAYISASPFLYQDMMGLSTIGYGLAFAVNALGLVVMTMVSARLVHRVPVGTLARRGLTLNLTAITVLTVLALSPVPAWVLGLPIFFAVSSLGLVLGNTTALALDAVPQAAGLASAVLGLLQFGLAGIASPLVSIGGATSATTMAVVMLVASLIALAGRHMAQSHETGIPRTATTDDRD